MDEQQNAVERVAEQMETERRYKILRLERVENDERRARVRGAILGGVSMAALLLLGLNHQATTSELLDLEIQALSSVDALKQYLTSFTPAEYLAVLGTASGFLSAIKHNNRYHQAQGELEDMINSQEEQIENQEQRVL